MISVDLLVAIPFAVVFSALLLGNNYIGLYLCFAVFLAFAFLLTVLFYLVYPVSVLEKGNFLQAMRRSSGIARHRLMPVSAAAVIPFIVSAINFSLAFFAYNPIALSAFLAMRFLTAMVYTYHMVLNPNVYFDFRDLKRRSS